MSLNYFRSRVSYSSYVVLRRHICNEVYLGNGRNINKDVLRNSKKRISPRVFHNLSQSVFPQSRRENHTDPSAVTTGSTDLRSQEGESAVSYTSRSHTCGILRSNDVGKYVRLCGWIQSIHFNGKFVQLRDWDGWTQLVFTDDKIEMCEQINSLKLESVIEVTGVVREREKINKNTPTGDIEIIVDSLKILNIVPEDLPIIQKNYHTTHESLQMEYRYLAIRYKTLQQNLRTRSKIIMKMREFLANKHNFVDVETPTLFRRTPGGAKEFVVPTKHPGKFYSLPQSPQQFKQLLMVGGIDRYFQIARCYRDEGSKPDRQPEFTQLDVEMSFVTKEGIIQLIEELLEHCWPEDKPRLHTPFPQMTYQQAMRLYGTDKPDTRFDMKIYSLSKESSANDFKTMGIKFQDTLNHVSKAKLRSFLESNHIKSKVRWQVHKYRDLDKMEPVLKDRVLQEGNYGTDDVILTATGEDIACCELLGMFRLFIADELESKGQIVREPNAFHFLWVVDFPLFLPKEEGEGLESAHHPFTDVHPEDSHLFYSQPEKVRGQHYDLVLNGSEVGGGSIRIHNPEKQKYVIENALQEDVGQFEHLLKAFKMGCPPHGGIALGLDRLLACIMETNSIRDVIAFPKSSEGRDPMSDAPAKITQEELDRYHISVVNKTS